jgi:hypothetical protein
VGLTRLAEEVRGDDITLVLADVGQRPNAGHVTDRPQPLACAQLNVDRDAARANRIQACRYPGTPARGHEQAVTLARLSPGREGAW